MDPGDADVERREWHTESEWARLLERMAAGDATRVPRGRFVWGKRLIAAACIVLAVGTSLSVHGRMRHNAVVNRVVRTMPGQRLLVHLSDSSAVTLGPATTLRYDATGSRREIELDGLAHFRVTHDASRPFVVRAGTAEVIDVGTEFVVRAYAGDSTVHVAVTTGIVSLTNRVGDGGRMTLRAGGVALVHGTSAPLAVHDVAAAAYGAWISGTLAFDDDALVDVARELDRWFDVDVRVAGSQLAPLRVTAIYNDPTLASVLDALSATLGIRYVRVGRTITLEPRSR
jgi:transmembrane sensor